MKKSINIGFTDACVSIYDMLKQVCSVKNLINNFKSYFVHYLLYMLLFFFFFCSESDNLTCFICKKHAIAAVCLVVLLKIFADGLVLKKKSYDNSLLRELINNSPMLSYVISADGNFLFGNARAERFFRTGIDITLDGEHIDLVIEELAKEERKETKQISTSGECYRVEKAISTVNGDYAWYLIHKIPLRDRNGKIYAIATFLRNIDAEKRIQEQRETYIATLSHDLKTPAIAQVRALELLLSGQLGEFNLEQKEMLQLTLDSCNYLYDMVYTLLSTCKFESGAVSLNYTEFCAKAFVHECVREMSNLATESNVEVKIDFTGSDDEIIFADRIELKRVVINLLSNAINYAFKNSTIRVKVFISIDEFTFEVSNRSPYIDSRTLAGLFRKYVSHAEKYHKVGFGLGLYLSKKIIDAHNGRIIARSSQSQTNTFGFCIPKQTNFNVLDNVSIDSGFVVAAKN